MAGKSTFLRSTALIAIMAQAGSFFCLRGTQLRISRIEKDDLSPFTGSFVPATSVELGVIDRIYSRVGARDELDRDRSTFMVEMDECTSILRHATARSLVGNVLVENGDTPLCASGFSKRLMQPLPNLIFIFSFIAGYLLCAELHLNYPPAGFNSPLSFFYATALRLFF